MKSFFKTIKTIFNDILKTDGSFSQGRVYLFLSIVAYYFTLGVLTFAGIKNRDIDIENFRMIIDALEYAMTLFGSYVFGSKFLQVYTDVKKTKYRHESNKGDSNRGNGTEMIYG